MAAREVVPFQERLLPAAIALVSAGVRRNSGYLDGSLLRLPDLPIERVVEPALRRYLRSEADDRRAWAVLDGDRLVALAGAQTEQLAPEDTPYTYRPPRSVTIETTALHAVSDVAASSCYPLLLAEARRLAKDMDGARLFVNVLPGDTAGTTLWRRLGLRPSSVMARRLARTWQPPSPPPQGAVVRAARPDDVEVLTDLALEAHRYHAEHTSSGVSPDQLRSTNHRVAAYSVAATGDRYRQLVAESESGQLVGSIFGSIQEWADDQIQRYVLPPHYGYVGLTVVTEAARGRGTGRALVGALMRWFAAREQEIAFVHYQADNKLSSRFWTRAGFVPHLETYSM